MYLFCSLKTFNAVSNKSNKKA